MAKNDNLTDFLTDIADSIREKKGTTALINPQDFAAEIASIETGEGGGTVVVTEGAVNFRDYDGTVLHTYTAAEFAKLTEMPELPTQAGLICQEWNWDLEEAQSYVAEHKYLEIGATYITDDGKTRLYIKIDEAEGIEVPLYFQQTVANGVVINWGDGSAEETIAGTGKKSITHTYSAKGRYTIVLSVIDGCVLSFGHAYAGYTIIGTSKNTNKLLEKVEIGNNITSISQYTFDGCISLTSITIPKEVTSFGGWSGDSTSVSGIFGDCYSLRCVIIPNGIKAITTNVFEGCTALQSVSIPNSVTTVSRGAFTGCKSLESVNLPINIKTIYGSTFSNCYGLKLITIPNDVTSIGGYAFSDCHSLQSINIPNNVVGSLGNNTFNNCYSLTSITIPDGVTSIGNSAFSGCHSLNSITIPNSVVGSLGDSAFSGCVSLTSITIPDGVTSIGARAFLGCGLLSSITIPDGVTSIGQYAFSSCVSLTSITIPDGVTSIDQYAFSSCVSLTSITIPDGVTSIGQYAFNNCGNVKFFDFSKHNTVPTLGTSAFSNYDSSCRIIVPYSLYDEWKTAANWSYYAAIMIQDYIPEECISLQIEADDVIGNITTTDIRCTAIINGTNWKGEQVEGVTINFNVTSDKFPKNESTTDSVTRDISFTFLGITETITITQGPYIDNAILCKYNVTSTSSATQLLYSSFSNYSTYFSKMLIDGEEVPIAQSYKFATTGEHEVIFKVSDDIQIETPYRMFYSITALTEVDCSALDLSKATSTSNSAGTAHMFYGCTKLKKIILPESIAYMGYYMFYNCKAVTELTILNPVAPTLYNYNTFGTGSYYIGYTNRSAGTNKFYVPAGATGYDASYWKSYLQNTSYCGFTKEEI